MSSQEEQQQQLPIIDLNNEKQVVAQQIHDACLHYGFFYIINHSISEQLQEQVMNETKHFFNQSQSIKEQLHIKNSNHYRGYFSLAQELSQNIPDWKEGINFALDSYNQWPHTDQLPHFKHTVLQYMNELTVLGHKIMSALSLSLHLEENYFHYKFTDEPSCMLRMFHYPSDPNHLFDNGVERWGVPPHKDYGVLTILKQDEIGGLEVENRATGEWISAPPIPNTFVVNIGQCTERWTSGYYKATLHRARNLSDQSRYSLPFFFAPPDDCIIEPLQQFIENNNRNSELYKPISFGEFMLERERSNHPTV
jgi:isopenicillin N synthase-like dioxygenase